MGREADEADASRQPDIGFLYQVAVVVVTVSEFGIAVFNHGFAINAETGDFDDFSVAIESLCATGVSSAAAYDGFVIDAVKRVFDQMIVNISFPSLGEVNTRHRPARSCPAVS